MILPTIVRVITTMGDQLAMLHVDGILDAIRALGRVRIHACNLNSPPQVQCDEVAMEEPTP